MASSFPEQISNLPSGGVSLVGTDTRTLNTETPFNFSVSTTLSYTKPFIVELILLAGLVINTNSGYASGIVNVFNTSVMGFSLINKTLTLNEDFSAAKFFWPYSGSIDEVGNKSYGVVSYPNPNQNQYMVYTVAPDKNIPIVYSNTLQALYFIGTITVNVYQ